MPRHAAGVLEFLFSRNRLDVAVSRAMCLTYIVANPRLLESRAPDDRADAPDQRALPVRGDRRRAGRLAGRVSC
jgi:hypothetical protein